MITRMSGVVLSLNSALGAHDLIMVGGDNTIYTVAGIFRSIT